MLKRRVLRLPTYKIAIASRSIYVPPLVGEPAGDSINLTTGSESDTSDWLTVAADSIIGTQVGEDADCWVVFDGGVDHWDSDITVTFTLNIPSQWDSVAHKFSFFSNTLDDARALDVADAGIGVSISSYADYWVSNTMSNTAGVSGPLDYDLDYDKDYYFTYKRNWTAQTGVLTVYEDAARVNLLGTKSIDLTRGGLADGQEKFRYFYVCNGYKMGDAEDQGSFTISTVSITPAVA